MKLKNILFVFFILLFLLTFVTADILSINSGGGDGFIINPGAYLESFFFQSNHLPILSNLILSSSSGTDTTNENLSVSYTSTDADGDKITNISDWRLGGNSIAVLNMPFDTRRLNGNARDYSTFQNNGTLGGGLSTSAPTWKQDCQVGGCYEFGNSANREYLQTSSITDVYYNLTLSSWINPKSYPIEKSTIILGSGAYYLSLANDSSIQTYWYGRNPPGYFSSGSGTIPLNTWSYVVAVWSQNQVKLYINGILKNTFAISNDAGNNASNIIIGAENLSRQFNGSIDEVQIYNQSLSPEQINILYLAGVNHHQLEKMSSQETSKGDVWQVAMTPNDAFGDGKTILSNQLTIVNHAPNNPSSVNLVSINGRNESNTNLNCSAYISDPDNSLLEVDVNWIKNGISQINSTFQNQQNGSIFSTPLLNGNLTLGDVWKCSVRSYDGTDYSGWTNSNNLSIIDITNPSIKIISPNDTNYTTLNIDFNISVIENENVSICEYSLDGLSNVTMNRLNDSYFWYVPSLGPGPHETTYYCNDTSGNWGTNSTNFNILNSAAISIYLSDSLARNVNWTIKTLPANDLDANGNNLNSSTDYFVNISATNTNVDLYMRANGDLLTSNLDVLGLGNETYTFSKNDSTVSNISKITMSTNYSLIGADLPDNSTVYLKFYLNAPISQAAGTYLNNLEFKAVRTGQTI